MDPASWQQVKDLIAEALRLAPSERDRFVRERCSDSQVAAEILALLGDGGRSGALADLDAAGRYAASLDLEPGTRIGPYVVIDVIGRGAMGQVFLVSDPRLRRRVALKCVLGSLSEHGDHRTRILHEARAAARVSHANVAAIYDVVEHDDRAFIVMEYVEGETLAARLKRERLSIATAVAVGRQLASALAAAHAKGVIHRDLKPGNIQITPDGSVKVLDFGIANAPALFTSSFESAAPTATVSAPPPVAHSSEPGTPPYMAPEQLVGQPADERTDVYSLGVVLFEMLTGRRPYPETTRQALVAAHSRPAPNADTVDARVPRALSEVVARMLETDPGQRFQSADDLSAALRRAEEGFERRGGWAMRLAMRIAVAAGVPVLAILALGAVNTLIFDVTLGRRGFAEDSLSAQWIWGLRSIVGPAVLVAVVAIAAWAATVLARLLLLAPSAARAAAQVRQSAIGRAAAAIDRDPSLFAQGVSLAAAAAIAAICLQFRDVLSAWFNVIATAPPEALDTLANHDVQSDFRYYMSIVIVLTGLALVCIVRAYRRRPSRAARTSLLACAGVLILAMLINDAPYRLVYDTDRERATLGGLRCYVLAENGARALLFCPDVPPPRNRSVYRSDPALQRTGITESIFTRVQ